MPFTPTTRDFSRDDLFKVEIDRLPNTVYFATTAVIPSLSVGEAIYPTPNVDIKLPGDKMIFDPLVITFLIAEDLSNYKEVHNWMMGLTFPEHTDQYKALSTADKNKSLKQNVLSDVHVYVLTNKQNKAVKISFFNCFPQQMGPLTFDASTDNSAPILGEVIFTYTHFTVN